MNKTDLARINTLLRTFGCTPREVQIYVQMLQMHPASVQEIARKLRQNRVTVHSSIEQLLKKGLLYETRKGRRRLLAAESPGVLEKLLDQKENEIEATRVNLAYVEDLLDKLKPPDIGKPTVKFYEDMDGLKKLFKEMLEARGDILVFSYADRLVDLLGVEYLGKHFERRAERNIRTKLILPPCSFVEALKKKREEYMAEIRLVPPDLEWRAGIFIWNQKMALISYAKEQVTCTVLENRDIVHLFRNVIFELMWQQLEKVD